MRLQIGHVIFAIPKEFIKCVPKMTQSLVSKNDYDEFFEVITPLRFSCMTPSGFPTIISLWYVYKNSKIYCATQKNAKIISYIKKDNKCAFEITTGQSPYKGIRGFGTVKLREDISIDILNSLIERFIGNKESYLSKYLLKRKDNEIAMEITPSKLFSWDYSKRMNKS